ncbi:hypothetical protein [Agromyces seonyuensis]|uniref:Uncharacterized protein n=1 Tax=Agromyces seonyuensis TaxID=2662446 RepID=A0A6I4P6E1_9MICO|nr:hypothetical protein [Agromyces seonyuensis]MWB99184.1 hypothetical protein [Agromyces seonyuensis]
MRILTRHRLRRRLHAPAGDPLIALDEATAAAQFVAVPESGGAGVPDGRPARGERA